MSYSCVGYCLIEIFFSFSLRQFHISPVNTELLLHIREASPGPQKWSRLESLSMSTREDVFRPSDRDFNANTILQGTVVEGLMGKVRTEDNVHGGLSGCAAAG